MTTDMLTKKIVQNTMKFSHRLLAIFVTRAKGLYQVPADKRMMWTGVASATGYTITLYVNSWIYFAS